MNKKTLALLLCLVMGLSLLAGCGGEQAAPAPEAPPSEEPAAGIAKEDIKVGFVYIGSAHDGGYTQAHDRGRQEMVAALGLSESQTVVVEDVVENADCEKTIRDLIDQGCNVVYANSFGHGEWMQKVAVDHPEVVFGHATGIFSEDNMSTFMGRIYEARYLSGIAAGLKTESNKIGYVAAMPIGEVVRGINAFTLGVKSVNPDATVEVVWLNSWYDPALEKTSALTLLDKGCDVITQHCDTTSPQVAAQEKGAFAIGYNSATYDAAPKAYITAPLFNWGVFYTADVQSVIDGTWESQRYWEGLNAGMVELDKLSENAAEGTQALIDEAEAKIKDGSLKIFEGPLKDNKGNEVVAAGQVMTDAEMESFNWFVEGVIGEAS